MPRPNQMQHHVQRRPRPTHRYPIAINDITVRHALHLMVRGGKILKILPMNGRAIPIQQPRPRHHPGPGIHPRNQPEPPRHTPQITQQRLCRHLGLPIANNQH